MVAGSGTAAAFAWKVADAVWVPAMFPGSKKSMLTVTNRGPPDVPANAPNEPSKRFATVVSPAMDAGKSTG